VTSAPRQNLRPPRLAMARTKQQPRKPSGGVAHRTPFVVKAAPMRSVPRPEDTTCVKCGAQGFARSLRDWRVALCANHTDEERKRRQDKLERRRVAAELKQERRRVRQAKREAAAKSAERKARAEAKAHAALVKAAAAESEESGGEGKPGAKRRRVSGRPHALARKTLRVRYALRCLSSSAVMQRLVETASGGGEAGVQALATLFPPSLFPPQPAELPSCARCAKLFDKSYSCDGECQVQHDFGYASRGVRRYGEPVLECSLCGEDVPCNADYDFSDSDGPGPCFYGKHTTSWRRVCQVTSWLCALLLCSDTQRVCALRLQEGRRLLPLLL
jgi:hypothetical protein